MAIVVMVVMLGFGLLGFLILDRPKAILWFLFVLVAYPVANAATQVERWTDRSAIEIYKIGVTSIPGISGLLSLIGRAHP